MSEIVAEGIIEADAFRTYLDALESLAVEARVHFNEDGLTCNVVDPANVAMYYPATLDKRAFESYDAPGSVTAGVALQRLTDKLNPADSDQLVNLEIDMETRMLTVDFGRAHQETRLIDPESIRKEPNPDEIDLPNSVTVSGEDIDEAVKIVDLVSDHVYLSGDPDDAPLTVSGQGDTDSSEVTFKPADCIDFATVGAVESVFSLDYLKEIVRPIPKDAEVTLEYGDEWPLRLTWAGVDGQLDVKAMLAPRIQKR